ncbi:hypothetical protein GT037_001760 [Alternaria burnsii]|uniref:Myb-like domain-containing protein n=1 Tax=Alternaria burnsii TaxID=1187904 RepID=A0A8H7B9W6_9PLEO|nr:uncharacterized protein GT037_001760 [Alternaria burnsii]KAF7680109.1 hypothetical protein GT037_001760 [Alternaria burnsii]
MPRFHQRGRPDSVAPWASSSYGEIYGEDHFSEAALTPPSSDEHPLPSKIGRRTVGQIVEAINLCMTSLKAFTHDDPAYFQLNELLGLLNNEHMESVHKGDHESARTHGLVGDFLQEWFDHDQQDHDEHHDGSPEASDNTRRIMRSCAPTGIIRGSFVSVASELGNIRSPAKKLNQDVGDMYGQYSESHVPRLRYSETQSSPYTDDVVPLLVGDHIAPSTEQDRGQGAEGFEKKWSTLKTNTADTKSNTANTVRSPLWMEEQDSHGHLFNAHAVDEAKDREVEQRVSPKLKSFDEAHRQLRDQDMLPPYKYVAAASPADDATDNKKPAVTKLRRIQERLGMVHDNLSKSEPKIIPVIAKLGHPMKAFDVKTATGFASPHNPTAPDDSMVDGFLEVANNSFTREEAFEILRMCGANLVAAVSVYRNTMGPEHLRQMLRAWLAPLENAEFRTAARFYRKKVDNQGQPWGISLEKDVGIEGDEGQPTPSLMNVREAFAFLGLESYNSVDFDLLQEMFEYYLSWVEGSEARQQLQQAYNTVFQHQNDNDCWKLCPIPWTKAMDEELMKWKNEDAKIDWSAIANALGLTVPQCRVRFNALEPAKSSSSKPKERKVKEQHQKETIKATSARTTTLKLGGWGPSSGRNGSPADCHYCQKCDMEYYDDLGHECEADRAAFDGDQPSWGSVATPTDTREPKPPVPAAYTVTYWASIESGDEEVHIPVNSSNVSGLEKAIVEGSAGMKKVWKWIQEKGLSDKVGLQDAFDLAKDMHGKDEDEELVIGEPMPAEDTSCACSGSSGDIFRDLCREWGIPERIPLSHDR